MPEAKHDSTQADKFRELARELECDEDEAKFEETVKKVATRGGDPAEAGPPKDHD